MESAGVKQSGKINRWDWRRQKEEAEQLKQKTWLESKSPKELGDELAEVRIGDWRNTFKHSNIPTCFCKTGKIGLEDNEVIWSKKTCGINNSAQPQDLIKKYEYNWFRIILKISNRFPIYKAKGKTSKELLLTSFKLKH